MLLERGGSLSITCPTYSAFLALGCLRSPPSLTHHTYSLTSIELNVFPVRQFLVVSCRTGISKAKRKCPMLLGETASLNTSMETCRSREYNLRKHVSTHPGSSYTALPHGFKQGGRFKCPRDHYCSHLGSEPFRFVLMLKSPSGLYKKKKRSQLQEQSSVVFNQFNFAKNAPAMHMLGPLLSAAL